MSDPEAAMDAGKRQGERVARSTTFERLARAGLAARGVIYGLIGLLAFELAIGAGGGTTNQQGALHEIAQQPFGKILLVLTAIGLAGYAIRRIVRAAIGHGTEDTDSTFERLGGLVSGIGYAILCATAIESWSDRAVAAAARRRRRAGSSAGREASGSSASPVSSSSAGASSRGTAG